MLETVEESTSKLFHMKTLILGIGNPIMGDDGAGIYVARIVRERLGNLPDLDIKELSVGGLRLVEEMLGYEDVIIVDSYASNHIEPGRVREFAPEDFKDTIHVSLPHGTNLAIALELYKTLEPDKIPRKIRIFTIDIKPDLVFREHMSAPVREAASKLAESIVREIEQG